MAVNFQCNNINLPGYCNGKANAGERFLLKSYCNVFLSCHYNAFETLGSVHLLYNYSVTWQVIFYVISLPNKINLTAQKQVNALQLKLM